MEVSCPAIYIPNIYKNISRSTVRKIFTSLKLGEIKEIEMQLGKDFQRVSIYFHYWFNNEYAQGIKKRFLDGECIKVIYDDPWFWKCRLHNRSTSSPKFVSKYNTRNQLIALKTALEQERINFSNILNRKEEELNQLRELVKDISGDDALLHRKRVNQSRRLT